MTKEEAIKVIEDGGWWDSYITESTIEGINADDELHEALDLALSALRPVSRERVEQVWKGGWEDMREAYNDVPKRRCSRCKSVFVGLDTPFCEICGAPMTDEAVDIVLSRLEVLKDGKSD